MYGFPNVCFWARWPLTSHFPLLLTLIDGWNSSWGERLASLALPGCYQKQKQTRIQPGSVPSCWHGQLGFPLFHIKYNPTWIKFSLWFISMAWLSNIRWKKQILGASLVNVWKYESQIIGIIEVYANGFKKI